LRAEFNQKAFAFFEFFGDSRKIPLEIASDFRYSSRRDDRHTIEPRGWCGNVEDERNDKR